MAITPLTRAFLDELQALLDAKDLPDLDRDRLAVTTGDAVALVRLPHRTGANPDIELEVDDQTVRISYGGEWQLVRDRRFALEVVDALLDGRVEIEIHHGPLWRTTRSYLDGSHAPFVTTRMPVPSLRPRTERRRIDFR